MMWISQGLGDADPCETDPSDPVCAEFYKKPDETNTNPYWSSWATSWGGSTTCSAGYSMVSLEDGTKNCVKDEASSPYWASFAQGWATAPAVTTPVAVPWYKRPIIWIGLAAVAGIGGYVYKAKKK